MVYSCRFTSKTHHATHLLNAECGLRLWTDAITDGAVVTGAMTLSRVSGAVAALGLDDEPRYGHRQSC